MRVSDEHVVPRGTLHIFRAKFLWQGGCYERLRIKNYGLGMTVSVPPGGRSWLN
jgi:hypothetical protein